MFSASLITAFGIIFAIFWLIAGILIYGSLIWQVALRRSTSSSANSLVPSFGLPEAILAGFLVLWFFVLAVAAASQPSVEINSRVLTINLIVTVAIISLIVGLLTLRGRNVDVMAGIKRLGALRAIVTGTILLFFAYPIISAVELIVHRFLPNGSSKQSIVELFNASQSIDQRVTIIVFAVTIAPAAEEFIFRFFIYGVLKRYFGPLFGLFANALLFGAVHGHLPSFVALFLLGACFTVAYEWSGSILVSMTMHALFNAITLVVLAFPETFRQ